MVTIENEELKEGTRAQVVTIENEGTADAFFSFAGADSAALQLPAADAPALPPQPLPTDRQFLPLVSRAL